LGRKKTYIGVIKSIHTFDKCSPM